MKSEPATTVRLSGPAKRVKEDLAPIYGLKNIISAGLILLGRLTVEEQLEVIRSSNSDYDAEADEIVRAAEADVAEQRRRRGRPPAKAG